MIKQLLLLTTAALLSLTAQAQFRYTFKDTTTPYTPLTGATSLNSGAIWDDDVFSASIPFTWKMDSTFSLNQFNLVLEFVSVLENSTNIGDANGFILCDADIADRGLLAGTASLSPIRYTTTGTTPNRIFKLELANAGFYSEYDLYHTMNDSFSMQIWVYETKNIVELHYGPSRITNPTDYFQIAGSGPFTAYSKHVDLDLGTSGSLYFLKGNPASPGIDTVTLPSFPSTGLNSWPADGKVYRFTPKAGCALPVAGFTSGTPSGTTVQYTYSGTVAAIDSLVWDFGDGQKQKITTGFTAPLSHTFTSNGKYNVCVTAYSNCGNHNFCKQTPLAVDNLAALGNVKVYPNPANDNLTIEGMQAGDKVTVRSIVGQEMLSSNITGNKQTLNLSELPAGSYMLMLSRQNGVKSSVRITKQ